MTAGDALAGVAAEGGGEAVSAGGPVERRVDRGGGGWARGAPNGPATQASGGLQGAAHAWPRGWPSAAARRGCPPPTSPPRWSGAARAGLGGGEAWADGGGAQGPDSATCDTADAGRCAPRPQRRAQCHDSVTKPPIHGWRGGGGGPMRAAPATRPRRRASCPRHTRYDTSIRANWTLTSSASERCMLGRSPPTPQ